MGTPLEGTYFQAKLGNAICVQSLDDSLNSAIHITYRISLRSSSLWEPRHPLLKVVLGYFIEVWHKMPHSLLFSSFIQIGAGVGPIRDRPWRYVQATSNQTAVIENYNCIWFNEATNTTCSQKEILDRCGNDPSAGSPTETLLRLHLPLNDKVWTSSRD